MGDHHNSTELDICPKSKVKKVWETPESYEEMFMSESSMGETYGCLNDMCCLSSNLFIRQKFDNLCIAAIMIKFFLLQ
jgi:hypothetical protein